MEYIAKYFENPCQTREGGPQYKERTEKIFQRIKDIEPEMKHK